MTDISEENMKIGKKLSCIAIIEGVTYSSSSFEIAAALQSKDDEIFALKARIEELEKASEWQPIETAPKDGRKILLTNKYWIGSAEGGFHNSIGSRKENFQNYTGNSLHGSHLPNCDYWGYGLDNVHPFSKDNQPTHWMPLPKPPKEPNE